MQLAIKQTDTDTTITMQLSGPVINTKFLPSTLPFLLREFPEVLGTQCFNENNLTFKDEVVHTEVGHLFEHMVLEELCALKVKYGHKCAVHCGTTSWNWETESVGVFHIKIDSGTPDSYLLERAISKGIHITEALYQEHNYGQPNLLPVATN
jgi:hypothetical protein